MIWMVIYWDLSSYPPSRRWRINECNDDVSDGAATDVYRSVSRMMQRWSGNNGEDGVSAHCSLLISLLLSSLSLRHTTIARLHTSRRWCSESQCYSYSHCTSIRLTLTAHSIARAHTDDGAALSLSLNTRTMQRTEIAPTIRDSQRIRSRMTWEQCTMIEDSIRTMLEWMVGSKRRV